MIKKIKEVLTNKEYLPLRAFIIVSLLLTGYTIWDSYSKKNRLEKLLVSKYTYGIVIHKMSSTYKSAPNIDYRYFVGNKKNTIQDEEIGQDSFEKLEVFDTILIRYSIEDNEIAQIVHCYWNDDLRKMVEAQDIEG